MHRGGSLPVRPERSEGSDALRWLVCHGPLMPRGSHFLLLRQKQVTKEKATPTIGLFLRCSEKSGTARTRCAQTAGRSYRFFPPLLGANQRGPVAAIFDRFAIGVTSAQLPFLNELATSCNAATKERQSGQIGRHGHVFPRLNKAEFFVQFNACDVGRDCNIKKWVSAIS